MTRTRDLASSPYGGYTLVALKEAGGDESRRFEARLARAGHSFAVVSNGGTGGCDVYHPLGDRPEHREELRAFEQFAARWNEGSEFAGLEDADQLVERLIVVTKLNRMRAAAFVLDGQDPWAGGDILTGSGASRDEVLAMLRSTAYASRGPRVWSREAGDFVLVA